jgi:hypothetical protein
MGEAEGTEGTSKAVRITSIFFFFIRRPLHANVSHGA